MVFFYSDLIKIPEILLNKEPRGRGEISGTVGVVEYSNL